MKYLYAVTLFTIVASALAFAGSQNRQAPLPKSPLEHELKATTPAVEMVDAGLPRDGGLR